MTKIHFAVLRQGKLAGQRRGHWPSKCWTLVNKPIHCLLLYLSLKLRTILCRSNFTVHCSCCETWTQPFQPPAHRRTSNDAKNKVIRLVVSSVASLTVAASAGLMQCFSRRQGHPGGTGFCSLSIPRELERSRNVEQLGVPRDLERHWPNG